MNPHEKWAKRPAMELISRLNDITCEVMGPVEDRLEGIEDADELTDRQLLTLMEEAHWITEELEHRINRTEWAGLHDLSVSESNV